MTHKDKGCAACMAYQHAFQLSDKRPYVIYGSEVKSQFPRLLGRDF